MKKVIRLTEDNLHRIVENAAKRILTETPRPKGVDKNGKRIFRKEADPVTGKMKKTTYYPMNNSSKYVGANNLDVNPMYKVGNIKARPSIPGKHNQGTILSNGFQERPGFEETEGGTIIRNPKGEEYEYPANASVPFGDKYKLVPGSQPDEEGYSEYNTFDRRNVSDPVRHNLYTNKPNWGKGSKQFGRKGDAHIVNPGSDDPYFLGDEERKSTHIPAPANESIIRLTEGDLHRIVKESVNRVLQEGQGFNMLKNVYRSLRDEPIDDRDLDYIGTPEWDEAKERYINNYGRHPYYDENGEYTDKEGAGNKPVNNGFTGWLGRRAAAGAIGAGLKGYKAGRKIKNKLFGR